MNRNAEHLVRESRRLPPIHIALSFLLATMAALTIIGVATRDASTKPHPQSTGGRSGGGAAKNGGRRRLASAIQQLTVVPVSVSADGSWNGSWTHAQDLIDQGKVGGVMLVAGPNAKPLSGAAADQVGKNVTRMQKTPGAGGIGLSVIAPMDGLFENEGYCSEFFPGAADALEKGIEGDASALVRGLKQIKANTLLAISLKDGKTGCAGGDGSSPAKMVGELQKERILYIARGAILEQDGGTPWATTYAPAASSDAGASRLRAVVASSKPRQQVGRATWRYRKALSQMHGDASGMVIATPDLSASPVQTEVGGSPALAVRAALAAGADLPLWSATAETGDITQAARRWWRKRAHRASLRESCQRMVRAKLAVFRSSAPSPSVCEPGG